MIRRRQGDRGGAGEGVARVCCRIKVYGLTGVVVVRFECDSQHYLSSLELADNPDWVVSSCSRSGNPIRNPLDLCRCLLDFDTLRMRNPPTKAGGRVVIASSVSHSFSDTVVVVTVPPPSLFSVTNVQPMGADSSSTVRVPSCHLGFFLWAKVLKVYWTSIITPSMWGERRVEDA